MGENKTPEYSKRATMNYLQKFDIYNLRLPKGTKDRINKQSNSINKFISDLVVAELERLEQNESEEPGINHQDDDYNKFIF